MQSLTREQIRTYYRSRVPGFDKGKVHGNASDNSSEVRVPCPIHGGGSRNSLAINLDTGIWKCHQCQRGGSPADFEMALGSVDFKEAVNTVEEAVGMEAPASTGAHYDYVDEQGRAIIRVHRTMRDGKKSFWQESCQDGAWVKGTKGVPRFPYRLDEVAFADDVIIVEGEKCVEALRALGYVATTALGGADGWKPRFGYGAHFTGKRVVIMPDNDAPGEKYGKAAADDIRHVAASLRVARVPAVYGDIADWIADGATREQIDELLAGAAAPTMATEDTAAAISRGAVTEVIAGEYSIDKSGTFYKEKEQDVPLANFSVKIVAEITEDDGLTRQKTFEMEANIDGRAQRFTVPAPDLDSMRWVAKELGCDAIVRPCKFRYERMTAAIKSHSRDVEYRTRFLHTGWRLEPEGWCYLHGDGAISGDGLRTDVDVSLPPKLKYYTLPQPPNGNNLRAAVEASIGMLSAADLGVSAPIFAAIWRAVLGPVDVSLFVHGQSGVGKTEVAALAQQHFGKEMTPRNIPEGWDSTANSAVVVAFHAKDAILVVDDYMPKKGAANEADRLLRAQGNAAGRGRLKRDGSLSSDRWPRGLIISTGEDLPPGQSLLARLVSVEVKRGHVKFGAGLDKCQRDAREGLYAQAMSGFLRWLAPQYATVAAGLQAEIEKVRKGFSGAHARSPTNAANLVLGLRYFARFAVSVGVDLDVAPLEEVIKSISASQAESQKDSDPVETFIDILASALHSGRVHLSDANGKMPDNHGDPTSYGWSLADGNKSSRPNGNRIGWITETGIHLDPRPAFAAVRKLSEEAGSGLWLGQATLWRRLEDAGKITRSRVRTSSGQPRTYLLTTSLAGSVNDFSLE